MFSFSFQSLPDIFQFEKFRIFFSFADSLKVMLWKKTLAEINYSLFVISTDLLLAV